MMRFLLCLILASFFLGFASDRPHAQEGRLLSGSEIEDLLTEKTAIGEWEGQAYRQYFAADGHTIFAMKGQRSALGNWRVNHQSDQYESWWEGEGWDAYDVLLIEGRYFWKHTKYPLHVFEILDGQQLLWSENE